MSHGDNRREREHGDPACAGGETGLLAIVATLVDYGVDFVVIGGFAVGHHGYPRATKDVDVVPAPDPENLEKLWQVLVEVEAQPLALGYFRLEELSVPFSRDGLLQGGSWDLSTVHGRLDIIQYRAGAIETPEDYKRLRASAVPEKHPFGTWSVAGYDDLIDLKMLAGRDQDMVDIRALREANDDTAP